MVTANAESPITPNARIGHVQLKVADLERALAFYGGVLGFEVTQRYGSDAVFLAAGGYHHHIALNTWESKGGSPQRKPSGMLSNASKHAREINATASWTLTVGTRRASWLGLAFRSF